jgi:pimeloyl-ACP methyl ester carboxylesterase
MNVDSQNIKHDYAQIGGVRLHYASAGTKEKLVILLHGFPEFWYSWRYQIPVLSESFTVVAPDLRGYNLSDKPERVKDYALENLTDDVTGLIRHFGREQAAIVGHDWGAAIAWSVAQNHPEYVSKLVAMQVPPPAAWRKNLTARQLLASWYMFLLQIPHIPEWLMSRNDFAMLESTMKRLGAKNIFTQRDFVEYKKSWDEPLALTAAVNYYRANAIKLFPGNSTKKSQSEKIKVPSLFIFGERDPAIVSETVRDIQQFIDTSYSELRVSDAGHWVHQEDAKNVNEVLLDFLSED